MSGFPTSFNQQSYQQTFGRLTTAASIKADKGMAAIKTAASSARQKIAQQPRNIWIASIATATFAAAGVAAYLARNQISNLVWPIPPQPINLQNTGTALNISTTENSTLADCDFSPIPLNNLTETQSFQTPLKFPQVTVTLPKIAEVTVETVEEKETPEVSQVEVSIETVEKEEEISNKASEQEEVSNKAAEQEEVSNKATEQEEASNKAAEQEEVSNKAAEQEEASNKAAEQEEASNKATAQEEVSKEEEVKPSESDVDSDETKGKDSSTNLDKLYTMAQNTDPYVFGGAIVAGSAAVLGVAWYVSKCCCRSLCKKGPARPKEDLSAAIRAEKVAQEQAASELATDLEKLNTSSGWKDFVYKVLKENVGKGKRSDIIKAALNNNPSTTPKLMRKQALALVAEATEFAQVDWHQSNESKIDWNERKKCLEKLREGVTAIKTGSPDIYYKIVACLDKTEQLYATNPKLKVAGSEPKEEKKDQVDPAAGRDPTAVAPPADNADPAAAAGAPPADPADLLPAPPAAGADGAAGDAAGADGAAGDAADADGAARSAADAAVPQVCLLM